MRVVLSLPDRDAVRGTYFPTVRSASLSTQLSVALAPTPSPSFAATTGATSAVEATPDESRWTSARAAPLDTLHPDSTDIASIASELRREAGIGQPARALLGIVAPRSRGYTPCGARESHCLTFDALEVGTDGSEQVAHGDPSPQPLAHDSVGQVESALRQADAVLSPGGGEMTAVGVMLLMAAAAIPALARAARILKLAQRTAAEDSIHPDPVDLSLPGQRQTEDDHRPTTTSRNGADSS